MVVAPWTAVTASSPTAGAAASNDDDGGDDDREVRIVSPGTALGSALARFEFESGQGRGATKALLVQWRDERAGSSTSGADDSAASELHASDWVVSWAGKPARLSPAVDLDGATHHLAPDPSASSDLKREEPEERKQGQAEQEQEHEEQEEQEQEEQENPKEEAGEAPKASRRRGPILIHTLLFLLAANAPIPPIVTISLRADQQSAQPAGSKTSTSAATTAADSTDPPDKSTIPNPERLLLRTNPLPAIFPQSPSSDYSSSSPLLSTTSSAACSSGRSVSFAAASRRKGVLHARWARARLAEIEAEIAAEARASPDGIGLAMAVAERDRILRDFGFVPPAAGDSRTGDSSLHGRQGSHVLPPGQLNTAVAPTAKPRGPASSSPTQDPRTPGGGSARMAEMLKGLRLETSKRTDQAQPAAPRHRAVPIASLDATLVESRHDGQHGAAAPSSSSSRPAKDGGGRMGASATTATTSTNAATGANQLEDPADDTDDDLFAMPISPRSPDMGRSPFSFSSEDSFKYIKGKRVV